MTKNRLNKIFYFRSNTRACVCNTVLYCTVLLKWYFHFHFHFIFVDCCYHSFDIKPNIFSFSLVDFGARMFESSLTYLSFVKKKKRNTNFFFHAIWKRKWNHREFLIRSLQMRYANGIYSCSIKRDQFYDMSKCHLNGEYCFKWEEDA